MKHTRIFAACCAFIGAAPFAVAADHKPAPSLKAYGRALDDASDFNGVILVARGDAILFKKAIGFADFELSTPLQTDQIFRLGSLTKPVTASAVLVAVDRGLMDLDASICAYVAPCPASWKSIAIRHLLSQSSGIPDLFGELEAVPVEETVVELARVLSGLPNDAKVDFTPGSEYRYSNFNYVLLGAALEKATGKHWEEALSEFIVERLGMRDTGYDRVFEVLARRVHGYDRADEEQVRNISYDDHGAYAAGGLRSTADDLFKWSRAAFGGSLWNAELHSAAFTAYNDAYDFGWRIRSDFFGRLNYNHTGGIDGFATHLAYYPADDLTVIVLSNIESEPAVLRACDLAAAYFGALGEASPLDRAALTPQQRCGIDVSN